MPAEPRNHTLQESNQTAKPPAVSMDAAPAPRYSVRASTPRFGNESYLVAAATAEILAGKTPDPARYDRTAKALNTGKTGDEIVARAHKYAESSIAKEAQAALDSPDPREALMIIGKQAEYDMLHAAKYTAHGRGYDAAVVTSHLLTQEVIVKLRKICGFTAIGFMVIGTMVSGSAGEIIARSAEDTGKCIFFVGMLALVPYYIFKMMGEGNDPEPVVAYNEAGASERQHDSVKTKEPAIYDDLGPHRVEVKSTGPIMAVNTRAVAPARESRAEQTTSPEAPKKESNEDQDYLAALSRKDMAVVQQIVNRAAQRVGYDIGPVWPDPQQPNFNKFFSSHTGWTMGRKTKKHGLWFSDKKSNNFNMPFFLRMDRMARGDRQHVSMRDSLSKAFRLGADGVIFESKQNGMSTTHKQYFVFCTARLTPADAVLLNDKGNVILPSDRFRKDNTGGATIKKEHAKPAESANLPGKSNDRDRTDLLTLETPSLPTKRQAPLLSKPVRAYHPPQGSGTDRYTPEEWGALQAMSWLDLPLELKIKTVQCCDDPFSNNSDVKTPIVRIGPHNNPMINRGPQGRPINRTDGRFKPTPEQLADIIRNHGLYLRKNPNGVRANLRDADLPGVDLSNVDLRGADMAWANLSCANLSGADFREANMAGVNLWGAKMAGADFARTDLFMVALSDVQLAESNLLAIQQAKANLLEDAFRLPEQPQPELKEDQDYLAALRVNDMKKAMKTLTLVAKNAGYNVGPVWHGTQSPGYHEFFPDKTKPATEFQPHGHGFWFADEPSVAQELATIDPEMPKGTVRAVYLSLRHMVKWERAHESEEAAIARAIRDGADGVIFENLRNGTSGQHTEYLVFNLVKAAYAAPVMYKGMWRIQLPSERFKQAPPGIRFSISATRPDIT